MFDVLLFWCFVFCFVSCVLFAGNCSLFANRCLLRSVRWLVFVVRCLLPYACFVWSVLVRSSLFVV